MTPKPLPTIISKEIELPVDYAVIRSMGSKKATSNITKDGTAKVWFKIVLDDNDLGEQLHIHLRFTGQDFIANSPPELLDVDFYIPLQNVPFDFQVTMGLFADDI